MTIHVTNNYQLNILVVQVATEPAVPGPDFGAPTVPQLTETELSDLSYYDALGRYAAELEQLHLSGQTSR